MPSPQQPTLLAVASHFLGQPLLSVYRLDTGDRVRQLTGHTERIRSLSFAADGRLLISTGDDQTVCVWSLTDLDAVLDKHGVLAGVAVDDSDSNGPVVVRIEPESPAGQLLAVGDHLSGYLDGDTFRPWNKAREFYDTWWLARPQAKLTVRRVRRRKTRATSSCRPARVWTNTSRCSRSLWRRPRPIGPGNGWAGAPWGRSNRVTSRWSDFWAGTSTRAIRNGRRSLPT